MDEETLEIVALMKHLNQKRKKKKQNQMKKPKNHLQESK